VEEKSGNTGTPVTPESFFTDETPEATVQQPQPTDVNAPTEEQTPEAPVWNGKEWTFKAAGKQWEPKDRTELMKWASFGVNYQEKARALNQQRVELLRMRKEIEAAKEAKADPTPIKEDVSSLFSNPDDTVTKKLAEMDERISRADAYALEQESKAMGTALSDGMESLQKEIGLTEEETDEIYLELDPRIPSLPDTAIDSPDKIKRLLRNLYFELHPDAIDEIVEKRAAVKADQIKKSLGAKIKVEGSAPSAPTGKPRPTDFLDAQRQLEDAWDTLPK
jgi:hypothetical protein